MGQSTSIAAIEYDKDGSGNLDKNEASIYAAHLLDEDLRKFDSNDHGGNFNGQWDAVEIDKFFKARFKKREVFIVGTTEELTGEAVEKIDDDYLEVSKKKSVIEDGVNEQQRGSLVLRRKYKDFQLFEQFDPSDNDAFKKAEGALFSYSSDEVKGTDNWTFRGALMYPRVNDRKVGVSSSDPITLTRDVSIVSLEFDKVDAGNSKKGEVDSLIFRAGKEYELMGKDTLGLNPINHQVLRSGFAYATDFNLGSAVPALELEWEPIVPQWGLGAARTPQIPVLDNVFEYRARFVAHAEVGHVLDSGGKSSLSEDETFTRLGPMMSLDFWFSDEWSERFPIPISSFFSRTALSAEWSWLAGLSGEPGDASLFEAGFKYRIDDEGNVTLDANFRDGETPILTEDTETFTVGLGIKF